MSVTEKANIRSLDIFKAIFKTKKGRSGRMKEYAMPKSSENGEEVK